MPDSLPLADSIRLSDYTYDLPDDCIARYPLSPRDASKLLVYTNGAIDHRQFRQLADQLPADSLLVFNDTKVIPARVYFQKSTGATIEILLLHPEVPTRIINDAMLAVGRCTPSSLNTLGLPTACRKSSNSRVGTSLISQ